MQTRTALSAICVTLFSLSVSAAEPVWRATCETVYEPSERNPNILVKSYDSNLTFDNEGRVLEEIQTGTDGTRMKRVREYYETGRLDAETVYYWEKSSWVKTSYKHFEYDERTGVVTLSENYEYQSGVEHPGNSFKRDIVRNADGNVTDVQISVWFEGRYDPTQRLSITYNAEGQATEILHTMLLAGTLGYIWVDAEHYTDIVWDKTDGQIVSIDDGLFFGNNRLASAHFVNDNGSKAYDNYDITATYDEGQGVKVVLTGLYQAIENSVVKIEQSERPTEDGGIRYETLTSYAVASDLNHTENYRDLNIFDAWDIEIESSSYYWADDDEANGVFEFMNSADVTYDDTYGYPLEVRDYADDQPLGRIVYSGYIDCAEQDSLRELDVAGAGQNNGYYDLQGRRVANPGRGLFIHNGKKIIINQPK